MNAAQPPAVVVGATLVAAGHRYIITRVDEAAGAVWMRTSAGPAWVSLASLVWQWPQLMWRSDDRPSYIVPGQIGAFG